MSCSDDGVGKLKPVCSNKVNEVGGSEDLGWTRPSGWGDISASVSLMRRNPAKAREGLRVIT